MTATSRPRWTTTVTAALLGSALLSGTALAKPFSYTYVQGNYADVETDGNDDAELLGLSGSVALDPQQQFILRGGIANLDYDRNLEFDEFSIGVGHPMHLSERSDVLLALDYSTAESDSSNPQLDNIDVDTFAASATSRTWLTNNVEGNLMLGLVEQQADGDDDSGAEVGAGIRVYVAPQFSVGATLTRSFVGDLDRDSLGVNARLQF